jgi:hypothetical protein
MNPSAWVGLQANSGANRHRPTIAQNGKVQHQMGAGGSRW